YWNPGPGIASPDRYDFAAFARATGEASVRTPFWLGARLGLRLFAGGYWSGSDPLKQRRIMVAGADPYETFTNPLLRSAGALLVRPDFHYHAPGGANLRAFNPNLGGRWAVAANFETTRRLGLPEHAELELFLDAGIVDPQAVPASSAGQSYTTLYDGGVGLVTHH